MKKRKLVLNQEKYDRSWQDYKEIWINKWNIICVKFVALVSFSCIIALIIVRNVNFNADADKGHKTYSVSENNGLFINQTIFIQHVLKNLSRTKVNIYENGCYFYMSDYWGNTLCTFNCTEVDSNQIVPVIQSIYEQKPCNDGIILHLTKVKFENSVMKKDWWSSYIRIVHLFFFACELTDIEDDAFINMADTKTIRFAGSQIPYYKKDMFKGLEQLTDLEFSDSSLASRPTPREVKYEYGLLEYVKNTIITLQVQDSINDKEAIKNLTGIYLPNLKIIDFRYNKKLTYIPSDAFRTPELTSLYFDDCNLQSIHPKAFDNAPKISLMTLYKNNFEMLEESTFSSLEKYGNITISVNNWLCTCEIQFLQKYFYINDLSSTVCQNGTLLKKLFENCLFTETTTSENPEETTKPSVTSEKPENTSEMPKPTTEKPPATTENPETTSEMSQSTTSDKPSVTSENPETTSEKEEMSTTTTTTKSVADQPACKPISRNFEVNDINKNIVSVEYKGELHSGELLYFMTDRERDSCNLKNKKGTINSTNTPYIMCKVGTGNLECFSGRSEPDDPDKTWLKNKDKIPLIVITTLSTLISNMLTGIGVYYAIQRKMSRKRKAKRQIFQQELVKPVYLMPIQKEPIQREPFPVQPIPVCCRDPHIQYDSAYLTPISQRYMRIQEYDTPLKRSLSDLSVRTVASYVTENQISTRPDMDEAPPLPPPRNRNEVVPEQYKSTNYW